MIIVFEGWRGLQYVTAFLLCKVNTATLYFHLTSKCEIIGEKDVRIFLALQVTIATVQVDESILNHLAVVKSWDSI